jgi:hypothetical protein
LIVFLIYVIMMVTKAKKSGVRWLQIIDWEVRHELYWWLQW